jgi:glycosyltransferase involved in cell wall biosynthesis
MNLLIVTGSIDNIESGPYWSVYGLISGLIEAGHSVTLIGSRITRKLADENIYRKLAELESKFNLIDLRRYGYAELEFVPAIFRKLVLLKSFDAIVIQGPWISSGWISFLYGKSKKITTIITMRGEFIDFNSLRRFRKRPFMPWVFFMLRNASMLHFLNDREQRIIRLMGIMNNSFVIPNGVSFIKQREGTRPKVVIYIGRLTEGKNLINLIRGWKKANTLEYILKIAGSGSPEYVNAMTREIGDDQTIELVGRKDGQEKALFLNQADWFVLPSLREGIPMAALEALSNGALGMFSSECNLNDFFEYKAAVLMPLDSDGIAYTFERTLNMDPEVKESLSKNSYTLLHERYLWSSIIDQFTTRIEAYNIFN